jgi:hypothetical protein
LYFFTLLKLVYEENVIVVDKDDQYWIPDAGRGYEKSLHRAFCFVFGA